MIIPKLYEETNQENIYRLLQEINFGSLIYHYRNSVEVMHLPFLIEIADGSQNLYCHFSKANTDYEAICDGQTLLITFLGPNGYVSPGHYSRPDAPTWNYISIHVKGQAQFLRESELIQLLDRTIRFEEARDGNRWQYQNMEQALDPIYLQKMLKHIVGVKIAISDIKCQIKMSQDKPEAERRQICQKILYDTPWNKASIEKMIFHNN